MRSQSPQSTGLYLPHVLSLKSRTNPNNTDTGNLGQRKATTRIQFDDLFDGTVKDQTEKNLELCTESNCPTFTTSGHPDVMFYTRVPKTGGTTAMWVFGNFSRTTQQFHYYRSGNFKSMNYAKHECKRIAKNLYLLQQVTPNPVLFDKHQFFIDFNKFDLPMPMFVSIVRDPVEQFHSLYYFRRFTYKLARDRDLHISMDDCILQHMPECMHHHHTLQVTIVLFRDCSVEAKLNIIEMGESFMTKVNINWYDSICGVWYEL